MTYHEIPTNGAVFTRFIELPNLISETKFSLDEDGAEQLKPIRDVIVEGLNVMRKVISNIDINFEGYKPKLSDVYLKFIPYYLWSNRGENEMLVWVNEN